MEGLDINMLGQYGIIGIMLFWFMTINNRQLEECRKTNIDLKSSIDKLLIIIENKEKED